MKIPNFLRFFRKDTSTTSKDGEMLTQYELKLMVVKGRQVLWCPDCRGSIIPGPCGGASQNGMCSKCYSEFNVVRFESAVLYAERNSNKAGSTAERKKFYGVE